MPDLNTDVRYVHGVGEARAKSLAKLGITDLRSLLSYFPRAYEDRREIKAIDALIPGEMACFVGTVASEPTSAHIRRGMDLVKLRVVDATAAVDLTYFNQSYLKNAFHTGESYVFYGKVEGSLLRRKMVNPLFEREDERRITGRIVPVYPLTAGVSQSLLHKAVRCALDEAADNLTDFLPEHIRAAHKLCHVRY
ncbi:MAG: ATP-dependent DNA helicase RecG, partial [Clostridia bacterium]|nr:ATP-dependent DNA helicase RecG [Clostridia bacterium]